LLKNSPAIDAGKIQTHLSHWTSPFWKKYFDASILSHGKLDIRKKSRIMNVLDMGGNEFILK
jgi:hypothetical protein